MCGREVVSLKFNFAEVKNDVCSEVPVSAVDKSEVRMAGSLEGGAADGFSE